MKCLARISPVPTKVHIVKNPVEGWIAKWPLHFGAIRGFCSTPMAAYSNLVARYNEWRGYHN